MKALSRITSKLKHLRPRVKAAEVNHKALESKDQAQELTEDCLQLFEDSGKSFEELKSQAWYARIWSTVAGGSTRKLAGSCANLVQAQKLLLEVLKVHARSCAKTSALTAKLAHGLRRTGERQSEIAGEVVALSDRLEQAEAELVKLRAQAKFNPADELSWSADQKLLLYKVMVLASQADHRTQPEEDEFLAYKLESLDLGDQLVEAALKFRSNPQDITIELAGVDSDAMKLVMFRNALAISIADGRLLFSERRFLDKLAKQLGIKPEDKRRLWREFSRA